MPVVDRSFKLNTLTVGVLTIGALATLTATAAGSADSTAIEPFSKAALGAPPKSWSFVTIPNKPDATSYSVVEMDGHHVLKVQSQHGYGNLVHEWKVLPTVGQKLEWSWRVDKLVDGADLTAKSGDDSPAKLCLSFDLPAAKLSLGERTKLSLARAALGTDLPTETLCYVWDNQIPSGTELPNAFTQRIRTIVLQSGPASLGQWKTEQRDIAADYLKAFGAESGNQVPNVIDLVISADTDNTGGSSLAYFGDVKYGEQ